MTTCKRLDLFRKTVNSFIECCLDLTYISIDKWLVIDDNSSEEDRLEMKKLYPFMTFIFKTPSQKGHARSINLLLRNVKTPYIFHLEDDWQFYHKDYFLTHLLQVINEDESYKQVLLNNMYSETPDQEYLVGGIQKTTIATPCLNYIIHEYVTDEKDKQDFNTKWGFKPNCSYWPHFSFRPGITDMSIFKTLGDFKEDVWHFEMNFAHEYVKQGYLTCFLPGMVCKHTGKLTHDKDGINAYVLNNEVQFYGEKILTWMKRLNIQYINLDRRPDRKFLFESIMKNISTPITRFSAVDGNKLTMTPQLYHLFDKNDYNYRRGIVGCALSHIKIWINHLYSDSPKDILMVMEDDLYFNPKYDENKFEDTVEKCIDEMHKNDIDLLFIQYTKRNSVTHDDSFMIRIVNYNEAYDLSHGGTGCYIITKKGIEKLLEFINETSMTNAIDTMMQKSADVMKVGYVFPDYVILDMTDKQIDTDIQFDFNSCCGNEDTKTLISDEIKMLYTKFNMKYDIDYTITKFDTNNSTYKLRDDIYVVVNDYNNLPDEFKKCRPTERLKFNGKYYLNL